MKHTILVVLLVGCSVLGVARTQRSVQETQRERIEAQRAQEGAKKAQEAAKRELERAQAEMKREMARAKAEIERVKAEPDRTYSATWSYSTPSETKKEIERRRKIQEAMRHGVVVLPLVVYPDDHINPGSTTDRSMPEELQKKPWWERLDCYTLQPSQITLASRPMSSFGVYEIEDTGRETRVTFAVPIIYDRQWHALSKGWVMIDNGSGNRYFPRKAEKGIPFDKVLVINGAKGHTLLFTVVYPRLFTGAQSVTFTDAWPIKTELPLNRAPKKDLVVDNVRELTRKKGRDIY